MNQFYRTVAETVLERVSFDPLKGKSVLITGVNGLLCSHMLCALKLADREHGLGMRVTCISRNEPIPWIRGAFDSAAFAFIQRDLARDGAPATSDGHDYIVHGATYGQAPRYLVDPISTMKLNSFVTADLLDVSARTKDRRGFATRFLYLSSSDVYGTPPPSALPVKEDFPGIVSTLDPRAPYSCSKRFSETLCKIYKEQGSVEARIARISPVFGPGVPLGDPRVLSEFIQRAIQTGEIKMLDFGQQNRRWLYISDALVMLFHILIHSTELVYNVSGGDLKTIAEMAECVAEETGAKVVKPKEITWGRHNQGAPPIVDLDPTRILSEVRLPKLVTLKEGVRGCVAWTRDLLAS